MIADFGGGVADRLDHGFVLWASVVEEAAFDLAAPEQTHKRFRSILIEISKYR